MATIYVSKDAHDGLNAPMKQDSYLTDPVLAKAVVNWIGQKFPVLMGSWTMVLDPGAGRGVWGNAVLDQRQPPKRPPSVVGVELRNCAWPKKYWEYFPRTDFLKWPTGLRYDLVIGNPPFRLAEKFIRRSIELLRDDGLVCFLLPGDFSHSDVRGNGLFKEHPPLYEVSLMQRPMFRGPRGQSLGSQNPNNYIVMLWNAGATNEQRDHNTIHEWLDWRKSGRKA